MPAVVFSTALSQTTVPELYLVQESLSIITESVHVFFSFSRYTFFTLEHPQYRFHSLYSISSVPGLDNFGLLLPEFDPQSLRSAFQLTKLHF